MAKIPDRRNEALEAYDKAIAINPKYYEAWINKGNCFVRIRKYKEAVDAYDKAIEIKPTEHASWGG